MDLLTNQKQTHTENKHRVTKEKVGEGLFRSLGLTGVNYYI